MNYIVRPGGHIKGITTVPGDKSISHRALILGALANGTSKLTGVLDGADCVATANVLRQLGVKISWSEQRVLVEGAGVSGFSKPADTLDFGNSGTSIRLFSGLLSGQNFRTYLTGDASLRRRPMSRVAKPLVRMGARITTTRGRPPLTIDGVKDLVGIDYVMPVASAQVKSSLLLAGLLAKGETRITEPAPTRDHTERMLLAMGVAVDRQGSTVSISGPACLRPWQGTIPGDFSSAAFLIAAAVIDPKGELTLKDVGVNPTRLGFLTALQQMGADIEVSNRRNCGAEDIADLQVTGSRLRGISLDPALVPLMIDEFPVLFVVAAFAKGQTVVTGAQELKTKESDRLASMAKGLSQLGVPVTATDDGITIMGARPTGGVVDSFDDHRVAMAFAVLGHRAGGPVTITDVGSVATSFPGYHTLMETLGLCIALSDSYEKQ